MVSHQSSTISIKNKIIKYYCRILVNNMSITHGQWIQISVDVFFGGPSCQGISSLNRYRKTKNPLEDDRNKQLHIYMDIVGPKYVLIENVVEMLRFLSCDLMHYDVGCLVKMNYQNQMRIMVAGAYGAQFLMPFLCIYTLIR